MESKYKEMRHATLKIGAENRRKGGGGGGGDGHAGQHKLFSLGQGPTMSPGSRRSGKCCYIAAGLLAHNADVSDPGTGAPSRFWTVGAMASYGNGRLFDACFRVFARCAKRKFQLFHFVQPSVENGSFSMGNLSQQTFGRRKKSHGGIPG